MSRFSDRFGREGSPPATSSSPAQELPLENRPTSVIAQREVRYQALVLEIERLPTLPTVVIEIMSLLHDEKANAQDFDKHIRKDQVLTGRMLKLVNSSFYSLRRKIRSISEAVAYMGTNTIRSLVLAATTKKILERELGCYGYDKKGLWKHSIACAAGAKFLALELSMDREESEELFIAGLLHDIGKLILAPLLADRHEDFLVKLREEGKTVLQAEREVTDFDHVSIARLICKKWKLAEDLQETIEYHHAPATAPNHGRRAAIVHLASYICNKLKIGHSPVGSLTPLLDQKGYAGLGIEGDRLRQLLGSMNDAMKEMDALFQTI